MKNTLLTLLLAACTCLVSGCGTVAAAFSNQSQPPIYRGTVYDLRAVFSPGPQGPAQRLSFLLDTPFSFAFDTLLLPVCLNPN